jgi:hypothetical protein
MVQGETTCPWQGEAPYSIESSYPTCWSFRPSSIAIPHPLLVVSPSSTSGLPYSLVVSPHVQLISNCGAGIQLRHD